LLELQAQSLESVKLIRRLQTWSAVVLSTDLDSIRAAREAVRGSAAVARTESVLDAWDNYQVLTTGVAPLPAVEWAEPAAVGPGAVPRLAVSARNLARVYAAGSGGPNAPETAVAMTRLADALEDAADRRAAAARLSAWQAGFLGELREMMAAFRPPPPDFSKAPAALRDHLVGRDGAYALYVYPRDDLWEQAKLDAFVSDVEARVKGLGRPVTLTGIAHNIHHSTASIKSSFFTATAYALGLIVLLVWIDLRNVRHTLLAISVLALGLPMLVGIMGLFGVDWNFANFFGLPILIGAGHEYGVFLVHRYREARAEPGRRAWRGWDVADRALLLCAFVTSSSFGFFWVFARHEGLQSLGLVMAVGSASIYLASVVALRPVLKMRLRTA
jgi:predicted RND superfamily exporter protein